MSQVAVRSPAERERNVTYNEIIIEHWGRDLLREAPRFEYFRFPRMVSIRAP